MGEWNKWVGEQYFEPWAESIRVYFEGADAIRLPVTDRRVLLTRTWDMPMEDVLIVGLCVVFITALSVFFDRLVFIPIARLLRLREIDYGRFSETCWQLCFYGPMWLLSLAIVIDAPWFYEMWRCWEDPYPFIPMSNSIYWLFIIQMAWYFHCLIFHVLFDGRKSDFFVMLTHHIVAIALIYSAFNAGMMRVGVLTLFCMDVCDVFLHITKILRFVDNVKPCMDIPMTASYIGVVISWVVFRLILFPWKVIYNVTVLGLHYAGWANVDYWIFGSIFLIVLYGLQLFWFFLIVQSGYKFVRYGEMDDDRDPTARDAKHKQN
uniref:TLC domain-containing protein n=1 Tax=Vannella robusta TaxID=1487602 RepID=A0A7S4IM55_9EUKA|mmetsp:Transcript_5007/g.6098  ORF Transcript_5007/g.6098 Transcript_5007/m.6098 type:complete len:320 (+) Transcript_5007:84-1043(+)